MYVSVYVYVFIYTCHNMRVEVRGQTQLLREFWKCGGLKENGPHRHIYLNLGLPPPPLAELLGVTLLKDVCLWRWTCFQRLSIPTVLPSRCELSALPVLTPWLHHYGHKTSETAHLINSSLRWVVTVTKK